MNPRMRMCNHLDHTFFTPIDQPFELVIDCGGNTGGFSRWIVEHSDAVVHGFEPDPDYFAKLPQFPKVHWHNAAVDKQDGESTLQRNKMHVGSIVANVANEQFVAKVATVNLEQFCKRNALTKIDLLKLDIEGSELEVFESSSDDFLRSISQITVEFHDFIDKSAIPRIEAIVKRMKGLDFCFFKFSTYTWGDCAFLNSRVVSLSAIDKAKILLEGKYLAALRRKLTARTVKPVVA